MLIFFVLLMENTNCSAINIMLIVATFDSLPEDVLATIGPVSGHPQ